MKILTVVFSLGPGGTEKAAMNFAEAYYLLGHESRILTNHIYSKDYLPCQTNMHIYKEFSKQVLGGIIRWNPDIIHIHSHGLSYSQLNKIKSIKKNSMKLIESNVFSTISPIEDDIDLSLILSFSGLFVLPKSKFESKRYIVVPNPIKTQMFKPARKEKVFEFRRRFSLTSESFVIGRIGQASAGSWSPLIVKIFDKLASEFDNVFLYLKLPSEDVQRLCQISKFKNRIIIDNKVTVSQSELNLIYSSFDVFLHIASNGESFGYSIAESILCGTPVITLATPWTHNSQIEIVEHLKNGFVCKKEKDVLKLLNKLIKNFQRKKILNFQVNNIKLRYDYLFVTKKVLNYLMGVDNYSVNRLILAKQLSIILNNSYGKTSLLFPRLLNLKLQWLMYYSSDIFKIRLLGLFRSLGK